MDFCYRTFAALFLLFAPTSCAPGLCLPDAWAGLTQSSVDLLRLAQNISAQVGPKDLDDFNNNLGWIKAEDRCDPETLKKAPESCLQKILSVSLSYSSELKELSKSDYSDFVEKLSSALNKLQKNLICVEVDVPSTVVSSQATLLDWEMGSMFYYILNRLISFSILTARVFAEGNPSLHSADGLCSCA